MDVCCCSQVCCLFIVVLLQTISSIASTEDVIIKAVAPVNPVKEGAFLAVYCQIWNSEETNIVTISRQLGDSTQPEMLTWNKEILVDSDKSDKYMLATRTMEDGSNVYFLSILDITRVDEGHYFCQVRRFDGEELRVIRRDNVNIDINYFPKETNPECSTKQSLLIQEGQVVEFNCSSGGGKPQVSFEWSKGNDVILTSNEDEPFSTLRYIAKYTDNKAIFVCTIRSTAFPDKERTCHIGPLTVQRDTSVKQTPSVSLTTLKTEARVPNQNIVKPTGVPSASVCKQLCSDLNYDINYWIIATIVFSIVAFIFIVTGFCLLLKYHKLASSSSGVVLPPRVDDTDGTYEKLEYRNDRKVYMALDKSWVPTHGQVELQSQYNVTPVISPSIMPLQYRS